MTKLVLTGAIFVTVIQITQATFITSRISHGKNATKGQFPYQVALVRRHSLMGQYVYSPFCGGSLIHPSFVLTAAHCVVKKMDLNFAIIGGVISTSDSSRATGQPVKVAVHEKYDRNKTFRNDLAIVKLRSPMVGPHIETIGLPIHGSSPKIGSYPIISGFGNKCPNDTSRFKSVLAYTIMTITDPKFCQYGYFRSDLQLCTRGSLRGCGTCAGDSGGPLVDPHRRTVIGIVSYGRGDCSSPSKTTVFTKVAAYESWIRNKLSTL